MPAVLIIKEQGAAGRPGTPDCTLPGGMRALPVVADTTIILPYPPTVNTYW